MPVITPSRITSASGRANPTSVTLTASDTMVYTPGVTKFLILRNGTGGALSPVIDGDGATSEYLPGYGSVSTTAGYAVGSIAAGNTAVVDLDNIRAFLKGVIAVTGGTGLTAILATV